LGLGGLRFGFRGFGLGVSVLGGGVKPAAARDLREPGCELVLVWGLVFGVWTLGFGAWGLGCGVWGLRFGVWDLGFGVES